MYTDPIAYFITWTCYGTWLPGDERGWVRWRKGMEIPQPLLENWCAKQMKGFPVYLDETQRSIVHTTVTDHCKRRNWTLHAINCRTNHCHCVVTATEVGGEDVRDQLKAWCTRKLNTKAIETQKVESIVLNRWWTRKGSVRYLFDDASLEVANLYTLEAQDAGGSNFEPK